MATSSATGAGDAPASLDVYGERIRSTVSVYEASLRSWQGRRRMYAALLDQWGGYGQLRRNPIDEQRLAFIDAEIAKQREKLAACRSSLTKFDDLQRQMRELANHVPVPTAQDRAAAADEDALMEIREELDDDGNVISSTVTPQSAEKLANVEKLLGVATTNGDSKTARREGESSSATTSIKPVNTTEPLNDNDQTTFRMITNKDGEQELVDDPNGFSVSVIPPDVLEMNGIAEEIDWDEVDAELARADEEELSEDEYGRSRAGDIPKPALLTRTSVKAMDDEERPASAKGSNKKKIVFADNLVKGPTPGGTPTRGVLKKTTSYPLPAEGGAPPAEDTEPEVITIDPPKAKPSRFKMARSSTDQKLAARHAQPSQKYQEKLDNGPVRDQVVERDMDEEPTPKRPSPPARTPSADLTTEERQRLYPKKTNLASVDLDEDAGVTKKAFTVPTLSPEALEAIRKKREAMGKKHKRRKSADPQMPVRSSSFDEHGPPPSGAHHMRSKTSTGLEEEHSDKLKEIREARLQRAKELLKAQDDIAWANAPLTPPSPDKKAKDPIAAQGKPVASDSEVSFLPGQSPSEVKALLPSANDDETAGSSTGGPGSSLTSSSQSPPSHTPQTTGAAPHASSLNAPGTRTPPVAHGPKIVSPRATKPPTPERRFSTDRPSPLSNEIKADPVDKQVQFSQQVVERLAPLSEEGSPSALPTVVRNLKAPRKAPPKEPKRKPSIDPLVLSPTPGSPPPENRQREPIATEQRGAVHHTMVRATPRSPPPHIAIHDLISDATPEHVRLAMRREAEAGSPTPNLDAAGKEIEPSYTIGSDKTGE